MQSIQERTNTSEAADPVVQLSRDALPKAADPVELGREAWQRRKADGRNCWDDWRLIGQALLVGRKEAMRLAKKDRPAGRKYNELVGNWVQMHGFAEIDKSDRAKLLSIVEKLDEVEAWRATLTDSQRATLNHPSSIWRAWLCPRRGNRGRPPGGQPQPTVVAPAGAADSDADDDREDWQRGLMLRASKAIGDADMKDLWQSSEPPDEGLIARVRKAAEAWTAVAEYLEQIRDYTPEQLAEARESRAAYLQSAVDARAKRTARYREVAERAWA